MRRSGRGAPERGQFLRLSELQRFDLQTAWPNVVSRVKEWAGSFMDLLRKVHLPCRLVVITSRPVTRPPAAEMSGPSVSPILPTTTSVAVPIIAWSSQRPAP